MIAVSFYSTNLSPQTRLSQEVEEAIKADPLYGPEHDRARHCIGIEYEVALEQTLETMSESVIRSAGI